MRILPTFRGYTVDVRLEEFRKVAPKLVFIDFDSPKGERLFKAWIKEPGALEEFCAYGHL